MKAIVKPFLISFTLIDVSALFLSDLATPCLLIDVGFLHKQQASAMEPFPLPRLQIGSYSLVPKVFQCSDRYTEGTGFLAMDDALTPGVCYLHTTVVEPTNEEASDARNLAELDLPENSSYKAHLVLGLNNHHVISYYWARSAGAGSSMEAPGIELVSNKLRWLSDDWKECNSNDGKRSEWVAFLRPKDTVQLLPDEDWRSWELPIWGVSSRGRPLGSEPAVICAWDRIDLPE
ncbi:hypothetical protein FisN_20Lu055 [Fistulifera solaris]|uniref:Uncharacterized protein n=1 Tax=Fistulifera solaris TaxID=1519565 RepID=A0A1Z5JW63_FISSO|nr:hypothetical protein FisN_20Lu055 [Fistulifera solaris]|eukprot:GAX18277.1 hypothetical protein FisN_20Lu055 [Fistulifera solaris]